MRAAEHDASPGDCPAPWLAAYPAGVPAHIAPDSLGTLADLFLESVGRFPDAPAISCFGASLGYAALGRAARAFAGFLQAEGLMKGDRVAIMMPNLPAYPAALFGTLLAGCTVVNVNPLYTVRELAQQLQDAGVKILVVLENFAHVAEVALPETEVARVVVAAPGDLLGLKGHAVNLISRRLRRAVPRYRLPPGRATTFAAVMRRAAPFAPVAVSPDDLAFLQYTGGTTGVAKGAMLTHRNVAANVEQSRLWFGLGREGDTGRVMVTALPLYHIFGLTACLLLMTRIGACCLLIPNPRDIPGLVRTLATSRFTMMSGVNTLFNALLGHPDFARIDFSRMEHVIAGGMAVQAAVAKRWRAATGRAILEGYGLSETSPVVSGNRPDLAEWTGTIGYPFPSTQVSLRAPDGSVPPPGEPGELCVRGPQVMAGYWRRPDETALAMTADGFFRTGDVAVFEPDGAIRIVDRMKDMIVVSGFNVYPNEVEDVLAGHPGIAEVAVVGVPDEAVGEVVVAYVVAREGSLSEDAVRRHARASLTGYKVPRRVVFRDSLPKTPVGKVLRRALREEGERLAATTPEDAR